jgi:thiol:disulfide interchange protein DsbD
MVQKIFGVLLVLLAAWVVSPVFLNASAPRSDTTHQLSSGLVFNVVKTSRELETALKLAKENNQTVMLDFYADWCVTCKEMEVLTFNDATVSKRLMSYQLIQVDMTKNTTDQQAILKRYGLFGPPAILFFDQQGQELSSKRVIGFMKPERFIERLE